MAEKVYLFGTCLVDMFYPESGIDALRLLELCGYEVIFPQGQTCCGQPPYNSGFKAPAQAVAQQTIDLFSKQEHPVVVPSASCAGMIKHQYPKLFEYDKLYKAKADSLAKRTFELIDFIEDKLPYEKANPEPSMSVALHESCAAQREMATAHQWRSVLSKLPEVEVYIPARHQECCGFGGTFSVKSEKLSAVMTEDKAKALLDTNADCISSGDCGCLMNLQGHIEHSTKTTSDQSTPIKPLTRLIAERFGVAYDD